MTFEEEERKRLNEYYRLNKYNIWKDLEHLEKEKINNKYKWLWKWRAMKLIQEQRRE